MIESTLSTVLIATSARDVWVILRKHYAGKHASTALAYENEIRQQRYKDVLRLDAPEEEHAGDSAPAHAELPVYQ
jgi:hypothetical protein